MLLQEKHKQEDMDRLKRGLPQRWGTIKPDEEDRATDPSIGMCMHMSMDHYYDISVDILGISFLCCSACFTYTYWFYRKQIFI